MRWFGLLLLLALAACDEPRSEAYSPERGNNFKPVAVELQSARMAQKIDGIATLVSPDSLTLLNAEIRAAEIASGFSQRSLERFKGIRSLGEQRVDNAERQASTDATQVALLKLRMRNAWGDTAPFLAAANRQQLVDELASGKTTIVRLDFPRSVDRDLRNIQITPLGGGAEISVTTIWQAPSGNLAMPGTSFFGLMAAGPGLRPGDRAKITAERSAPISGVIVPASAVVVFAGKSWCYVEKSPGEFERKQVSLATPVAGGYLTNDFAAGTKVVVHGASALLSREADPGASDDDDDAKPRTKKPVSQKEPTPDHEHRPIATSDLN
jgi:hypothetical protein